jgi:CBS-domain-containing membrane protein
MGDIQVRRLPVLNREKRLVGIVSLGDIAISHVPEIAGESLASVSEPGGRHTQ